MELNSTQIVAMYKECRSVLKIAQALHVGTKRINEILAANKVDIINKKYRTDLPESVIINLFNEGMSVNQLGLKYAVDRSAINRILAKHNINKRNGSESMYLRMSQATPEERKSLVSKAHQTVREKPKEYFYNLLHKGTFTKHKTHSVVGQYEDYVYNELVKAELNPVAQKPVGLYNIDIVCGYIAIEIHITAPLPHTRKNYMERVTFLLKQGYCVVYYKTENRSVDLNVFSKLVDFCKQYRDSSIMQGMYFLLDADCEVKYIGRLNGDEIEITFTRPGKLKYNGS